MRRKSCLLFLTLFTFLWSRGQDCSSLSFTWTSSESRCVSTGSITVNITGGSGNYNYKATGPVTTPLTSSNVITGLAPGYYSVLVKDLNTNCTRQQDSIYVSGTYSDPRFQLTKTDATCAGNDGTLSTQNQLYGRSPFTYTILDPSPSHVGESNATGDFSGLLPGEYTVQLQDSCGGIQVRKVTIDSYSWWFDSVSVVRNGCDSADVFIRLRDNRGNTSASGSAFAAFEYGYVKNGDTTWLTTSSFSLLLGTSRNLDIVAKDDCGNIHATAWSLPDGLRPSLSAVGLSGFTCSTFTASVSGQNLTSPDFCLYDTSGVLISCNATGTFSGLDYGSYCIRAHDACYDTTIIRCFTGSHPEPSVDAQVSVSNRGCSTFTATITGASNLTGPGFCLYDTNHVQILCNTTGVFDDLPYGSYCIEVHDSCTDSTIVRCFTVSKLPVVLTGYSTTGFDCTTFGVQLTGSGLISPQYCLYDSLGNVLSCDSSGLFDNLPYGAYCVKAISCGDTTNSICFSGSRPVPSVATDVDITDKTCTTFTVTVSGQSNLSAPGYCLYDSTGALISCDSTGVFHDVPYGSYCIKIHNNSLCYDTTITRCFTQLHDQPSVDATMQVLSSGCSTVSFQVNGTHLTSPTYCLYDSAGHQVICNSDGKFMNYPYGSWCVRVQDGCIDTTMNVCQVFSVVHGLSLSTSKSCTIGKTYVDVQFASSNAPYNVKVYHPSGGLLFNLTTSSNPYRLELSALPAATQYKIIGTDNCGPRDSASITPDANIVTTTTTVRKKCPSSVWSNGSGDIRALPVSNSYSVSARIVAKNGSAFTQDYSSIDGSTYVFADLEPAQYVVAYTQSVCNGVLYDTVVVPSYAYPTQGQSALYQCDNNGFSLSADVKNGVSPYSYQIIGSLPDNPSIVTDAQTSAIFSINNGTTYSLVRLRTVDACGNATLSDVSVLPLQNISVTASDSCYYQNITLSVDTIPNATYYWYKKTTPADSVLLDSGLSYNLPFFVPEQTGQYMCKVNVNNGCLTRIASFNLPGSCYQVLPTSFLLHGRKIDTDNQLYWTNTNESGVTLYTVERKQNGEPGFSAIGNVAVHGPGPYIYTDAGVSPGTAQYRLKVSYVNRTEFSNTVVLASVSKEEITVYPNPVRDAFRVMIRSEKPADYKVELLGSNGQLLYTTELRNVSSTTLDYTRNHYTQPGIYLLRIINRTTGKAEIRKLVFE